MHPFRLLVLAALLYIAWRLLKAPRRDGPSAAGGKKGNDDRVEDVLMEDPVCHKLIPKSQAIRLRRDGTTYYFCSEQCCDTFTREARGNK
jgi:YHS domain-containing protein